MGAPDIFSGACRPSQTAHLPLSPGHPGLGIQPGEGGVSWAPPRPPQGPLRRLPPTLRTPSQTPAAGCSKAPQGLLSPTGVPGPFARLWVHRAPAGDSGDLVDPFMHVGIYPTRHLATLRESELLPAFSGASPGCTRASRTATGQDSLPVQTLSGLREAMFLLNSRAPLVTATCGPNQRLGPQAPLLPKLRGQFADFPRPASPRHALGFSPRGTCVGSRYGRGGSFPIPFSRAPGIGRTTLKTGGHSCFHPVLTITVLPGLIQLDRARTLLGLPRCVRDWASRCRDAYHRGSGILTGFPFGQLDLGVPLGPTNPRLTTHCRGTLAPSAIGILTRLRCYYHRDLQHRPVHRTSRPGFCPADAPPYRITATGRALGSRRPA